MKKFTLKFADPEVEAQYRESSAAAKKLQMRLGLLMPAVLYVFFGFFDPAVFGGAVGHQAQLIHIIQGTLFGLLVLISLRMDSVRFHVGMVSGSVIIAWTSHLYLSNTDVAVELAGEGYLMVIWVWLVSGLSIVQSARVMLIFLAEFVAFWPSSAIPPRFVPAHLLFFLAALLFGVIAGYLTEYYRRQSFLSEEKSKKMEAQFIQSQKMEAITTLVGGIAHDFNNTLSVITGNIYLAKQNLEQMPRTLNMLESVETAAFRSAAVIKQLLAFSRKGLIYMEPFQLVPLLDTTARLYQVSVPASTRFDYRNGVQGSLLIRGDANQLEQVLFNLLNNARDAVAGVSHPSIALHVERWRADSAFRRQHPELKGDAFARISVSDNGCGIDLKHLTHIFDPFFTTKAEGTGLGLSMVFGTIHSHGGVITVDSTPGQGSTFSIYLPEQELAVERPQAEQPPAVTEGKGGTILIADDNDNVLDMLTSLLENLGYRVLRAHDGQEAVSLYRRESSEISLVILDVVMPGMGGIGASEEIRRIDPAARLLFLTGYDPDQNTDEADLDAEEIIMKPFNVSDFSRRINELLSSANR